MELHISLELVVALVMLVVAGAGHQGNGICISMGEETLGGEAGLGVATVATAAASGEGGRVLKVDGDRQSAGEKGIGEVDSLSIGSIMQPLGVVSL